MNILEEFFSLRGKNAIITGASKGLGKGIAEAFAAAGAKVYMVSRSEDKLRQNQEEIRQLGGEAYYLAGDVNDPHFIEEVVTHVDQSDGKIDILVNNAGVAIPGRVTDITAEQWDQTMETNLKSVFFFSQAVAKVMKREQAGRIINMASVLGVVADHKVSPYCISKGGVIQMTKAFALELAKYNIQVNALAPAFIRTDMNDKAFENEKYMNYILSKTPLGRLGQVNEIAGAALFLASPIASYMTGHILHVDGGWTAQ
ncbi:NAD(P)-dependent dehydrogenase (short-subunit alcohol dehydrogenase family) [Caldalkalibacillus uzonensis]|uniref:NAD(P)-dependent dehydrogenase (Short-subunit alcohol dehydrogenase family) n=1 Tax=Caldalkalibacillus uzonensis TaxID=353224 RepID=A0ABU0CU64_9BACI|nr:glucose 1-dehydrogenase [Caldalkalibacillus uzonensis]MDQ0339952.1 NAD(P)-dependent dehydrogenase (short-subunit alcohol dehydrogenase family) [Caldalkalibacillus uzonensis]